MTEQVERVARAIWPEIGTDYTYDEAVARANGLPDDDATQAHHQRSIEYARDMARAAIAAMQPTLAKHQPCGCVVCTCGDESQCHGCGAKSCGTHEVGDIPNPVYATAMQPTPQVDQYKQGFDDGCAHMKEDYEAGERLKVRTTSQEAIEHACAVIDAFSEYDQNECCDGRECGCQGSSVHEHMKHQIRALAGGDR